jgi:glycerophosphoryl diester phosphodiesterase
VIPKLEDYLARVKPPAYASAVCGHRGASATAPENTLAAFRGAVQAGCDLVELDVLLTRDEELVVFHDEKLGRTTDRPGRVAAMTLEELRACDAGCWFGDHFRGEKVPTLREALDALEHRVVPMIEIKTRAAKRGVLIEKLKHVIEATGYADRAIAIAWDDVTARAVRDALPQVLISRIAFTRLSVRRAAARGFDGVVPWRATVTSRFLREASASGIFVAPWTVNRPKDMEFFGKAQCDIMITDVPHVLREHLEARVKAQAT